MKTDVLLSVMAIASALFLVGGSTYAYFSDVESSDNNFFTAGILDLQVDGSSHWTENISVSSMKPGDSDVSNMSLKNGGDVNGSLYINITDVLDSPGTTPESETTPDNGEISQNMNIVIWTDDGRGGGIPNDGIRNGEEPSLYNGLLSSATTGPWLIIANLNAGATTYVSLSYSVGTDVGNEIQGDECTFTIEYSLQQV